MTDITKKQFVFSSRRLVINNMREYEIFGKFLYVHDQLRFCRCTTADNKTAVLLGNAFCADVVGKRAEEDIGALAGTDTLSLTRWWTGRWVLITEGELISDASGLMNVLYGWQKADWIISSSPALLAVLLRADAKEQVKSTGISWRILPGSILPGVKTLLCTQKILFGNQTLSIAPKQWIRDYRALSTGEKCRRVADMLVAVCQNMHRYSGRQIWLALTGGKDSRLVLSALLGAGVPFSVYTAAHPQISHADKTVPVQLAKSFGVEHRYLKSGAADPDMRLDYDRFCAGNANGADAYFYTHGVFSQIPKDALVIRSGLFEAGQTYARSYASPDEQSFFCDMAAYYRDLQYGDQKTAFAEWQRHTAENEIAHIDLRDRFYIEQRVGGWVSAIEQSLDMNDFLSIQIANNAELLSVLLSCQAEEREALSLSYETMRLLEPGVLSFPVNRKTWQDKIAHIADICKHPATKFKNFVRKKLKK